jgi:hypothetical protein
MNQNSLNFFLIIIFFKIHRKKALKSYFFREGVMKYRVKLEKFETSKYL